MVGGSETALFALFWCNNFAHKKTGSPQIVRHRLSVLSEEPGAHSILSNAPAVRPLGQAAFILRSQLFYRSVYSTLLPTAVTAFASTTWRISLPSLTTTKCKFIGESGFPGTVITADPVQFGLTV